MAVIGFLTYEDLVAELAWRQHIYAGLYVVRVQTFTRTRSSQIGLELVEFLLEVGVEVAGDTLVCRFSLGNEWDVAADRVKRDRRTANADEGARIISSDLKRLGYSVHAGIISATKESTAEASQTTLWRFEKDKDDLPARLVALEDHHD
jgi:hypothetical protein